MKTSHLIAWIGLSTLAILVIGGWYVMDRTNTNTAQTNTNATNNSQTNQVQAIDTFAECVSAGYLVQESYPRRCVAVGRTFTEEIGNELELTDLIQITTPRPNASVTFPVAGTGQARGTWFFEASFPVWLEDTAGNVLSQSYAQANGEWMTNDFVDFTFQLESTEGVTGVAWLVLGKANPSGLEENDQELRVPLTIQ